MPRRSLCEGSFASEQLASNYLGIRQTDMICDETSLACILGKGEKVPDFIFRRRRHRCKTTVVQTLEVKRVLNKLCKGRVRDAMNKISDKIIRLFEPHTHHIVFVVRANANDVMQAAESMLRKDGHIRLADTPHAFVHHPHGVRVRLHVVQGSHDMFADIQEQLRHRHKSV